MRHVRDKAREPFNGIQRVILINADKWVKPEQMGRWKSNEILVRIISALQFVSTFEGLAIFKGLSLASSVEDNALTLL